MTKKQRANEVTKRLKALYPQALCSLQYKTAWELLVATRLSAQCTDARVNLVTPALFAVYPTAEAMAKADPAHVGELIHSCGFFNTKSKDLVEMSRIICKQYGGVVPDTVEELVKLPGVGRKTANLICGDVYGKPAVVTDTHCIRIAGRLGLTDSENPVIVERQLRALLEPSESSDFCHRIVLFGRDVCVARSPRCGSCPLSDVCPSRAK